MESNTSAAVHDDAIPSSNTVVRHNLQLGDLSDPYAQMLLSAMITGCVLFTIIATLYIRQIRLILQSTPPKHLARTLTLCGVYTIVGAASLTSLIVYRASVLCDAICHFTFVVAAYQFFCICIDYTGGESNFIKHTGGLLSFNLQTPPCCCCLTFLQPAAMTKNKFIVTRVMVLQMSIVQGTLLFVLNVINTVDPEMYDDLLVYFVPFIVASILTGVWGLQITARMIAPYLPDYKIMPKYFAIQLVLIFCKLQPAVIQLICFIVNSINENRITTKIMENTITQLLILFEMILLSLLATRIYKLPTKGTQPF